MPIIIYDEFCNRCNLCAEVCPGDIIVPDRARKAAPVALYQEECWHCGTCVNFCPRPKAMLLTLPEVYKRPIMNKVAVKPDGSSALMTDLPVAVSKPPVSGV